MEPRNEYFSLLSLNSLKNKEEFEFTSLDSLKFSKRVKKRRGKKQICFILLTGNTCIESPLDIHKMSSQVICRHFLGFSMAIGEPFSVIVIWFSSD